MILYLDIKPFFFLFNKMILYLDGLEGLSGDPGDGGINSPGIKGDRGLDGLPGPQVSPD
jgi:hypothetical protein